MQRIESREVDDTVEKYVIGETYSGNKESKIIDKMNELELAIKKLIIRHNENHSVICADVTQVWSGQQFCQFLVVRSVAKMPCKSWKESWLRYFTEKQTPNPWRLAQARRVFLVVLSVAECPITTATRSTRTLIQGISLDQAMISLGQETMGLQLQVIQESLASLGRTEQEEEDSRQRRRYEVTSRTQGLSSASS